MVDFSILKELYYKQGSIGWIFQLDAGFSDIIPLAIPLYEKVLRKMRILAVSTNNVIDTTAPLSFMLVTGSRFSPEYIYPSDAFQSVYPLVKQLPTGVTPQVPAGITLQPMVVGSQSRFAHCYREVDLHYLLTEGRPLYLMVLNQATHNNQQFHIVVEWESTRNLGVSIVDLLKKATGGIDF